MSRPSRRDKLKDQVEASTKGFAFDALIGTLSEKKQTEETVLPTERDKPQNQEVLARSTQEEHEIRPCQTAEKREAKSTVAKNTIVKSTTVEITSNYCRLDLDISDRLAPLQTPSEQAVYNRLYRLSYGEGKNTCTVSVGHIVQATGIKSPKTVTRAIEGLIAKGHVAIADEHHNNPKGGTSYRVFLPVEINGIKSKTKIKEVSRD